MFKRDFDWMGFCLGVMAIAFGSSGAVLFLAIAYSVAVNGMRCGL